MVSARRHPLSDPEQRQAAIRAAATVVLLQHGPVPAVLMGQRGAEAAFMPSKYVFPGGAVDAADHAVDRLSPTCAARLSVWATDPAPAAIAGAALRELAEETGLHLHPLARLRFIFRAITPPGRSRRFDARFLLADAADIVGDMTDFSGADQELAHLHWVPLPEARRLDLPFITEVVLAEVAALAAGQDQDGVPFFDNASDVPTFRRIG
jgi:8-oxo-dGTP pyrophosphatase MutT (NUDIX family)